MDITICNSLADLRPTFGHKNRHSDRKNLKLRDNKFNNKLVLNEVLRGAY